MCFGQSVFAVGSSLRYLLFSLLTSIVFPFTSVDVLLADSMLVVELRPIIEKRNLFQSGLYSYNYSSIYPVIHLIHLRIIFIIITLLLLLLSGRRAMVKCWTG